jgi:hypothetical protein
MVTRVMNDEHYNISSRRALVDDKLREWLEMIGKINNVTLDQGMDMFRWDLNTTRTFSVRSVYLHLLNQHAPFRHKFIWKLKIPLKINIFFIPTEMYYSNKRQSSEEELKKGVISATFVMLMKQSNIYSLIIIMLNKFGGLFILQQAYHRLSQFLICLGIGFIIKMIR